MATLETAVDAMNAQTAAFSAHVDLIAGATQAATDAAAAKTAAETDAASIAVTKGVVDGQAADIATAVADINNAIDPKLPLVNLLKDGGRFVDGTDPIYSIEVASPFSMALSQVVPYNGSSFAEAGKFFLENSTYGGPGAALSQTVADLLETMTRPGNTKRYGPEFYIAEMTAGSGTAVAPINGHYLTATSSQESAFLNLNNTLSFAAWLRLTSGSAWVENFSGDLHVDGVAIGAGPYEMQVANNWVHVAGTFASDFGYISRQYPATYSLNGSTIEIALPIIAPTNLVIPPHSQPLLTV